MEAPDFLELLDRIDAAGVEAAESLPRWSTAEVLAVADRLEVHRRRQPTLDHRIIDRLTDAVPADLGGTSLRDVLTHRLRLSSREAGRRIRYAANLGPRRTLTGQRLDPTWAGCAAAQAAGLISAEHLTIIGDSLKLLPTWVDAHTRDRVEADLARHAATLTPDQLRVAARTLVDLIDPDGPEPDDTPPPAPQRDLTIGPQHRDGTSDIHGRITPELRAYLEAIFATYAAPGTCNPEHPTPCVDGAPDDEQVRADTRTAGQRRHDALTAIARAALASGQLGQHHGLPVTVIATTTVADLERGAGIAVTGGGTHLPVPDLIRMSRHAYHYLTVFDTHTHLPLYLGRTRRIASAAQRIVCHAMDRGCTHPGCTVPGYWCQIDHLTPWAAGGATDITNTGLACGPSNRMKQKGWTTQRINGRVHWTPPTHLDTGQPRINHHHHPHEYLTTTTDDDGEKPGAA